MERHYSDDGWVGIAGTIIGRYYRDDGWGGVAVMTGAVALQ